MPSRLSIPPSYRSGLQAIADLANADRDRLVESLRQAPSRLATERLADEIEQALPDLTGRAIDVVEALLSLIAVVDEDESIVGELARDVAHSEDVELADDAAREALAAQMVTLLGLESLALAAHAYNIVGEHERTFHDARILTDIRPVFGRVATEGAHAALIVATLKIDFHTSAGPVDSCFFALDHADLIRLRRIVNRALDKTDSLKELIAGMDLPYWEYREVDEESDAASS